MADDPAEAACQGAARMINKAGAGKKKSRLAGGSKVNREASNRVDKATRIQMAG